MSNPDDTTDADYERACSVLADQRRRKEWPSAVAALRRLAEGGHALAQLALARRLHTDGGAAHDPTEAARYLRLAAEQGNREAQHELGQWLVGGVGVERDGVEAVRYYRLSADQGYAPAQYDLAQSLNYPSSVAQDEAEAVRYYRLAAQQNHAAARDDLARCLADAPHRPLYEAVVRGDVAAAREALAQGASARYVLLRRFEHAGQEQTPTLYVACVRRHAELVELLLAHGADPNEPYRSEESEWWDERTCLIAAFPSVELADLLLEKGADPNKPDATRRGPAIHPLDAAGTNAELVALLQRHGARRTPAR